MADDSFARAIREMTTQIQILVWRREAQPIQDRDEVRVDLALRVTELAKNSRHGKQSWRKELLELAAYALFAAVADE